MEKTPPFAGDGLIVPEVGSWAVDKYDHFRHYAQMFSTSMKKKWELTYVDLFAGAGLSQIEGTQRIVPAAALLALELPFSRFVFCELDERKLLALEDRVRRRLPSARAIFLLGDTNDSVANILKAIPAGGSNLGVLNFCFVDPFACRNLKFSTIRTLASRRMDFFVLIPSGMDAGRNLHLYGDVDNPILDEFLGGPGWRRRWVLARAENPKRVFGDFVANEFGEMMKGLGYIYNGLEEMKQVRSTEKNLPLYHLCMFSRDPLGAKLWRESMKSSNPQRKLF